MNDVHYAGFFIRFIASLLDTIIIALPIGAVVYYFSDGNWFDYSDYISQYSHALQLAQQGDINALNNLPRTNFFSWDLVFEVAVLAVTVLFWRRWRGATPGKKMVGIAIVDANTLQDITNQQALARSLGYIPSTLLLGLGFLMVAIRPDKRALHDLIAGTAVIHTSY